MHCVYLIHRMAPYHEARARALAQSGVVQGARVTILELASATASYGWERGAAVGFERVTLFADAVAEHIGAARVWQKTFAGLTRLQPDVVYVPGWMDHFSLAAAAWCGIHGVARVLLSDSQFHDANRRPSHEEIKRQYVRRFHSAFVAGRAHAAYLSFLGMPVERCITKYDCVDNEHFSSLSLRTQLPRTIVSVGRFIRKKNFDGLLRGFALATSKHHKDWRLIIYGDGPLRGELQALRDSLDLKERVAFPGWSSYIALPAAYRNGALFILPSTSEQWGLVVNEAMASGLPTLVARAAGAAEMVVEGVTGFTFDSTSIDEIGAALVRMLSGPDDLLKMGAAARRHVDTWSLEQFTESFWNAGRIALRAAGRN